MSEVDLVAEVRAYLKIEEATGGLSTAGEYAIRLAGELELLRDGQSLLDDCHIDDCREIERLREALATIRRLAHSGMLTPIQIGHAADAALHTDSEEER